MKTCSAKPLAICVPTVVTAVDSRLISHSHNETNSPQNKEKQIATVWQLVEYRDISMEQLMRLALVSVTKAMGWECFSSPPSRKRLCDTVYRGSHASES